MSNLYENENHYKPESPPNTAHGTADEPQDGSARPSKQPTAQQIVEIALACFDLGVDIDGNPFGVRKGGHVARPLSGGKRSVRKELSGLYFRYSGRPASQNALTEAMAVLEYEAEQQGEPKALALRTARPSDNEIFIDLGNKDEHVIRVTANGWDVLDANAKVPVLFRRSNLTAALPMPRTGGDLNLLWKFVNMHGNDHRQLLIGWLVAALILVGLPCPILALLGEQGTAKTSSARRVFALVDPTSAPVRRPPNDADRLLHALQSSRATIFDNLSSIQRWLSDALCRAVTGEADVDRSLYTDSDVRVIQVQAVVGFTGIDVGSLAGDLAERTVWGELAVIPPSERRSERELNAEWDLAYPSMFGGLLDLVVLTLQQLPQINLAEKPRMADFAEVLAALDLATGSSSLEHYRLAQESVSEEIVDTNTFLTVLAQTVTERWEGTSKALHTKLPRPEKDKFWPEPRGISGQLRRYAPDLRKAGWEVQETKPDPRSKRPKTWTLVPPGVKISDAEIAHVQAAIRMHDLDIDDWIQRLLADGAAPSCVLSHANSNRVSHALTGCRAPGCTVPPWNPAYAPFAASSQAIDARVLEEVARLGLTLLEFTQLVQERAQAGTP